MNIGFREILLILVGYLIVRFILGVRRARRTMGEMRKEMEQQMRDAHRAANQKPEGHISIDPGVKKDKKSDSDSGDYVDFEEVD